ncbi:unnamed protein product [Closterium sp. NIES-53]
MAPGQQASAKCMAVEGVEDKEEADLAATTSMEATGVADTAATTRATDAVAADSTASATIVTRTDICGAIATSSLMDGPLLKAKRVEEQEEGEEEAVEAVAVAEMVLQPSPVKHVTSALGQRAEVKGMGKAMFKGADGKMVGLKNVLWVPNLAANLISVRRLQKAGMDTSSKGAKTYTARIGERVLWDLHEDRDVYNEMWQIPVVPMRKERQVAASINTKGEAVGSGDGANGRAKEMKSKKCNLGGTSKLGEHEERGAATKNAAFFNPTSATGECDWLTLHRRMGHVALPILQQLVKNEMVAGIRVKGEPDEVLGCPTCMKAKFTRYPFSSSVATAKAPLDEVVMDVVGPLKLGAAGAKYFLTIVDVYTRMTWVRAVWGSEEFRFGACGAAFGAEQRQNHHKAIFLCEWGEEAKDAEEEEEEVQQVSERAPILPTRTMSAPRIRVIPQQRQGLHVLAAEEEGRGKRRIQAPNRLTYDSLGKPAKSALAGTALIVGEDEESDYEECAFAFFSPVEMPGEPATLKEALESSDADEWKKAKESELKSIEGNGTWELVELPEGRKAITSKWLFKIKSDADGKIERYKSRLVAKGYQQKEKVNYKELFAPVPAKSALAGAAMMVGDDEENEYEEFAFAFFSPVEMPWELATLKEALESSDAEEWKKAMESELKSIEENGTWELVELSEGRKAITSKWLFRIKSDADGRIKRYKSRLLREVLEEIGFTPSSADHSMFMLGEGEQRSFMVVYVDDILIFSPSSDLVKEVILKLQDKFKCKALGDVSFYLVLHIERDVEKRCMRVHQRKYLEALAANFGQSEGHVATPFPSGFKCVKGPEEESVGEEERRRFHSLVGSLMYAAVNTRPDVAFAIGHSGWVFYDPVTYQFFASQDVTFDESVCYYRSRPHRGTKAFPPPLRPPPQRPVPVVSGDAGGAVAEGEGTGAAGAGGVGPGGAGGVGVEVTPVEDTAASTRRPRPTSPPGNPSVPQFPPRSSLRPVVAEPGGVPGGGTGGPRGVGGGGAGAGGTGTVARTPRTVRFLTREQCLLWLEREEHERVEESQPQQERAEEEPQEQQQGQVPLLQMPEEAERQRLRLRDLPDPAPARLWTRRSPLSRAMSREPCRSRYHVDGPFHLVLRSRTRPPPVLPQPLESNLCVFHDPLSDYLCASSPFVSRVLSALVTHPTAPLSSVSVLVTSVAGFASSHHLDYAAHLFELGFLAATVPHLCALLLTSEEDPEALDIPIPRTHAEAVSGPWASFWIAAEEAEIASYRSAGTYVDIVPPPGTNVVNGRWLYKVKRPPGSPPVFKARYVARGFSQREGVDFFETFAPTPKMTTLRVLLHIAAQRDYELYSLVFSTALLQGSLHKQIWLRRPLGFTGSFPPMTQWQLRRPGYGLRQAPREWHDTFRSTLTVLDFFLSSADPSLFVRRGSTPFFVLVYILTRFRFLFSMVQLTSLAVDHGLTAPPLNESFESSGPYHELVGCLMYLMTCTHPDLAYPLSVLARFVAPGRHRPSHWYADQRVANYVASTSGTGLVLEGKQLVSLTGFSDSS